MKTALPSAFLILPASLLCMALSEGYDAASSVTSCHGRNQLSYVLAPSSSTVGDVIRVAMNIGAGAIDSGTALTVRRMRFDLSCDSSSTGIDCAEGGPVVSYQGDLTTTCPSVTFTSSHAVGDTLPNQVVFTSSSPIRIPAGTESYCHLEFNIRIEAGGSGGGPDAIKQIAGLNAATGDGVCDTTPPLSCGTTSAGQICLGPDCHTTATTCEIFEELSYPSAPNRLAVGTILRPRITLGAGHNSGASSTHINRFRFNLDCSSSDFGLTCADDGPVVSYQGGITSDCGVTWSASHAPGDMLPNQVVFTPSRTVVIPPDSPEFCSLEFNVRVEARSNDATPDQVEQVCGFDAASGDASCDAEAPSASGDADLGFLGLTPVCDDGNACNGLEVSDENGVCLAGTPLDCDDANSCTTDQCDPAQGCTHFGNGSCRANPKEPGYWKRLCRTSVSGDSLTLQDVDCINNACTFSSIATIEDLCARLDPEPPSDKCEKAEAQYMALMLNVCRGRLADAAATHSRCDRSTTIGEARAVVDTLLCDPARDSAKCSQALCVDAGIDSGTPFR